jgi:dipeptidyl aminopeptidase/acylaminoacyl peptidase
VTENRRKEDFMRRFFGRIYSDKFSLAILIASPLLVLVWHTTIALKHARAREMAAELASAREFFGGPRPNHAGTKMFFAQTSDNGISAYFVDAATGKRKFLFDHEQQHLQGVGLMGWSPDDKLFAYSVRAPAGKIVICDGSSGEQLATVSDSKIIMESVWLSDSSLAYVNSDQNWSIVTGANGEWNRSALFTAKKVETPATSSETRGKKQPKRVPAEDLVRNVVAISSKTVAWQQRGTIWMCDAGSDGPIKVWESVTNRLLDFYFSQDKQVFRLHGQDEGGEFIESFYPAFQWHEERVADLQRIPPEDGFQLKSLMFIQDGLGYARFLHGPDFDLMVIRPGGTTNSLQSEWAGEIESVAANNNHIYIIGSPSNAPAGLWDYDVQAQSLNPLVPGTDRPLRYAQTVPITRGIVTNSTGATFNYYLSRPANFAPGRKYPLVIGFTGFRWRPQEQAIPNAGAYFAALSAIPMANGGQDAISLCEELVKRPDVDADRVYVMGVSAGANLVGKLLEERPDLWRGAICFSPVFFPDISKIKIARLLSDSGSNDTYLNNYGGGVTNLIHVYDSEAAAGVAVTLAVHENASHIFRSSRAEQQRIEEIIEFLQAD